MIKVFDDFTGQTYPKISAQQEVVMAKRLHIKMMVMVMSVLFLVGVCGGQTEEMNIERSDGKCTIIIATVKGRSSEFKEAVIHGLVERYQDTCTLEVMHVSKGEQLTSKRYDVVVLVDRCWAQMRLNGTVKTIIDEVEQENIVLFVTAANPNYEYTYGGIDAITSASQKEKEQEVIQEIADSIDELLR
jgi:hypothetical protein